MPLYAKRTVFLLGLAVLAILLPLFVSLGLWQWGKAESKSRLQEELTTRSQAPAVSMPRDAVDPETLRFRRILFQGEFDASHQVLIDNRLYREQAGYHVITPLKLAHSDWIVLVNRGWVPASADHQQPPDAPVPTGSITLTGIATLPPQRFFNLAAQPLQGWSPVWQNLDMERFRSVLGTQVHPLIIQLDADAPAGFLRDWPKPAERVDQHRSYALQWFGFAVAAVGIWLFLLWRRP